MIVWFVGCGYKPTNRVVEQSLSGKIFVDTKIDIHNIRNSILVRDALIGIITKKLNSSVVSEKSSADATLYGELLGISEGILESGNDGYAKMYRQHISLYIVFVDKQGKSKNFTVSNYYDYVVDADSVATQTNKEEAIRIAIQKALSTIFSKIAIQSL